MASGLHEHGDGLSLPEDTEQPDAKRARTDEQGAAAQPLLQAAMLPAMDAHQLVPGMAEMAAAAAAAAGAPGLPHIPPADSLTDGAGGGSNGASQPVKRGRGRPAGSRNKINKTGSTLMPHVMLVAPGEDVGSKLRELSRAYRRSLVVLAASGTLSVATLMQVGANGQGVGVTLHGHFTILSISGALLQPPSQEAAHLPRKQQREPTHAFLSASLANPSGGVVGGTVAGPLQAAGEVTLVVGHWDPDTGGALPAEADGRGTADSLLQPQFGNMGPAALVAGGGLLGGELPPLLPLGGGVWPPLSLEQDAVSAAGDNPPGPQGNVA